MPVSDILTAVVSAVIIASTYKQLDSEKETAKNASGFLPRYTE
jgi:hypothetical protein